MRRDHQLRSRITRLRSLSRADRRLLMRAAIALATARVALRVMRLRAARNTVVRSQAAMRISAAPERIVWAVETAGRAIPGGQNCLVKALAAEAILLGAGHQCELRIGVAKSGSRDLAAHAWLETSDGKVVIGDFELDRYRPLPSLGRPE